MRLKFDGRLYSRAAVDAAAAAFTDWAEFDVKEKGGRIIVAARPVDGPLDEGFSDEFCNHVLGAMRG
ncbi:MAG TPA: hypothetical protein DD417_17520 [Elusimicrobia bacterium]|nr:hypothetical protein [Elusimicrobiota bacterium]